MGKLVKELVMLMVMMMVVMMMMMMMMMIIIIYPEVFFFVKPAHLLQKYLENRVRIVEGKKQDEWRSNVSN